MLDKVVIFEGPERWICTDSRWPMLNSQITSNKGTIAAWRQAEITFVEHNCSPADRS